METLIIIKKTSNGYVGSVTPKNDPMCEAMLDMCIASATLITNDNYNDIEFEMGYCIIEAEDYNNIDSFAYKMMRKYGFRKCDGCGDFITPQDIRNNVSTYDCDEHKRLCAKCLNAPTRKRKISLAGYHESSGQVRVINGENESFDLSNVMGIGIEFEINSHDNIVRNGKIDCTEDFYREANPHSRNRIWRVEKDCTVKVEFISNVFTKKAFNAYDLNTLVQQALKLHNDESIPEVGLHVHLTKTWLGLAEREQVLNFLKLQYFVKSYEKDFRKICGRKESEMRWCNFLTLEQIQALKQDIADGRGWDAVTDYHRYGLINSNNTIEWRFFKSTNDSTRIRMWVDLILAITENIKNVPFEKCYCLNKVLKQVPANVLDYWRQRGAFLSTNAKETRGEVSL